MANFAVLNILRCNKFHTYLSLLQNLCKYFLNAIAMSQSLVKLMVHFVRHSLFDEESHLSMLNSWSGLNW